MSLEIQVIEGMANLKIDEDMTIYQAVEIRDRMLECFNKYDGLILDFKDTIMCDAAGIQLICSAQKTGEAMKKKFSVVNASEAVIIAAACAGMHPEKLLGI